MLRIVLLILITANVYSQSDTINKTTPKGKKNGYWLVYLDSSLNVTRYKERAVFYGFDYYENGRKICPLQNLNRKNKNSIDPILKKQIGNPVLLNGEFKFYYKDGTVEFEDVYINGLPNTKTAYRWSPDGKLITKEVADYKKQYKNQTGSCYYESIDSSNTVKDWFWYGKGENGKWEYQKK